MLSVVVWCPNSKQVRDFDHNQSYDILFTHLSLGDVAMEEHGRHFPDCIFVTNGDSGNIPLESDHDLIDSISNKKEKKVFTTNRAYNILHTPLYPDYANLEKRKASFANCHSIEVSKNDLAEAGFYYGGE